jgi:hypothetical protein
MVAHWPAPIGCALHCRGLEEKIWKLEQPNCQALSAEFSTPPAMEV